MSDDLGEIKVSVIIRTKNEERWISNCLRGVFSQSHKNIEVILVDNCSEDNTVLRAKEFPVTVLTINDFLPGKAINDGIRASSGDYIVCLSGHCLPVDSLWLANLIKDLGDSTVAGVYGRQQPLSYSSDTDKRDLVTVFGLDRKIQIKDTFFHNANSAFRREVWSKYSFDESVTNVEDRLWGKAVIDAGYKIIYEPDASVYHWHGIHHDMNADRARNVIRVLESVGGIIPTAVPIRPQSLNVTAIIPLKGKSRELNGEYLLMRSIRQALKSNYVKNVCVAADDQEMIGALRGIDGVTTISRPSSLSDPHVDVIDVHRFALKSLEDIAPYPDLIVLLEESYQFREPGLIDRMIERLISEGLDTVVAAMREERGVWLRSASETVLLGEGFMPRALKSSTTLIGLLGLGCVTFPACVRDGTLFSKKVGLFEVKDPLCSIEIRNEKTLELVKALISN